MFGGLHARVGRDVAHSKADLDIQAQLTSLVEDNSELRRMYKHLENQLAIASEELKCTALLPPPTHATMVKCCIHLKLNLYWWLSHSQLFSRIASLYSADCVVVNWSWISVLMKLM